MAGYAGPDAAAVSVLGDVAAAIRQLTSGGTGSAGGAFAFGAGGSAPPPGCHGPCGAGGRGVAPPPSEIVGMCITTGTHARLITDLDGTQRLKVDGSRARGGAKTKDRSLTF